MHKVAYQRHGVVQVVMVLGLSLHDIADCLLSHHQIDGSKHSADVE